MYDPTAGRRTLDELQGSTTAAALLEFVAHQAPGLDDWILGAVFGGTYQREGLSLRDRQLLNLGALSALGGVEPQLEGHLRTCLRIGMSRAETAEALVHLVPYVGLPRAMAALRALATVPDEPSR
jgi:4-carboxymuconolactone decarboxylase